VAPPDGDRVKFYLGTHETSWLGKLTDVPLFVSHRRLALRKGLPRATTDWALDSGGFTELSMFGEWRTTPEQYVAAVRRYRDEIGRLQWASPQDSMCESWVIAKTGLSVHEHQVLTVENYQRLRDLDPELPWVPVIQGDDLDAYRRCVDLYDDAGVDLTAEPKVGVGSVCRRQGTASIALILETLAAMGLKLHGYGVKADGLRAAGQYLTSADSMAWSYRARRDAQEGHGFPGCTHKTCANCLSYALRWRARITARLAYQQWPLTYGDAA
jgi:hypothetical protein